MADGKSSGTPASTLAYQAQVALLVRRLTEADEALSAITAGQVDAVLDPTTAAPILLSRAQEALARSEQRYRNLITHAPSLVFELTRDGIVTLANEAVRTSLGWDPESLYGRNLWDTLAADTNDGRLAQMLNVMQRRDVTAYELPMRTRDGRTCWVAWNSANRYATTGELRTVVLFGVDETSRREAEEKTRRVADAELARSKAEAANKAKMEFLAVMSHELRTPLNAIGGYAQLLEMGLKGPVTVAQVEDLQRIRRSQTHLLGLINDMMNFVRLETGRVVYHNAQHPVREILDTIEALTGPQLQANGLSYQVLHCEDDLRIYGDRDKVQQILINLVSNSIKFTPAGGHIEINCEQRDASVAVEISDTGKGIPANKLEEIFDPFVQVNPTFSRPQDGVGLGLAISRDLARGMGGDLSARSEVGVGSTFILLLPNNQ